MAQVKVRNLHTREHVEMFRDEEIRIPAGEYIEMGRAEAVTFLGQVTPLNQDGSGECVIPKKLKIEEDPEEHAAQRDQPFRFNSVDGKQFRTQAGLEAHEKKLQAESKEVVNAKPVRRRRAPSSTPDESKSA